MKTNPSHEQLSKSLDRRIRHLMIKTLESFEKALPQAASTSDGQIYKSGIRTFFNDIIRAQRDELLDYEVEYRPLRLSEDNILAITQTFMQTVQKVEFGFSGADPYFKIYAAQDKIKVLDSLRNELDAGVLFLQDDSAILQVVGIYACVDCVLPCFDRYRFHDSVRLKYKQWRQDVVKSYCDRG